MEGIKRRGTCKFPFKVGALFLLLKYKHQLQVVPCCKTKTPKGTLGKNPAQVVFFTHKITNPFICFLLVSDNGRTLEFPGPFSFISKRLVNHTIGTKIVANFENCKLHCYYEHNCVSVNYHLSTKTCELNNATHRWHNNEFKDENGYLYHGADVSSFLLTALLPLPSSPPPHHHHHHHHHHHRHHHHHNYYHHHHHHHQKYMVRLKI